jgi:GT2 family glycosyltransferase
MQQYPFLDLSVVTYNSEKWLSGFIKSLLLQSYPLDKIYLYFTDNSSSDSTYEKLETISENYKKRFADIVIEKKPNIGFGAGHNNNIFKATSEYIIITNVDLEFEKDSLINMVDYALKDSKNVASWEFRQKPFEHPKYYNPITLETNWSSSACIMFLRAALEKVGGYDKKIFMYGEDVDVSYRLRDAGYKLKYYPRATVWHYAYEYAREIKPLQFYGSTMTNVLLRFRFGSLKDIITGCSMYLYLFLRQEKFPGQRKGLIKYFFKMIRNIPYFIKTRKHSNISFHFLKLDYEKQRDGAFYEYKKDALQSQPLVSVIIRTYNNRMEFLKEAVSTVVNQTYRNIELVVVEDGSNFAEGYIKNIPAREIAKVKYLSLPKVGRCLAGNKGLEISSGEYCVFLDEDDAFYPEHIEILVTDIMKNHVVAAYSNAAEVKTKILQEHPLEYQEGEYNVVLKQKFSKIMLWHHNYIPIQSILFTKKLYYQYGGFDTELENLEDWNLWTRYSLHNDFDYVAKTTSLYRVPYEVNLAADRQAVLDEFYEKAKEKQNDMMITLSVSQILEMQKEVMSPIFIMESSLKGFIKNKIKHNKFLGRYYIQAKDAYYKIIK